MYNFASDYTEGALPEILTALCQTNYEQTEGYGCDPHCENARRLILSAIGVKADVQFVVGGTQANLIVLTAALRPHQAAICVESGHINVHETGAPEACGHKVIAVSGREGKLYPDKIDEVLAAHLPEHMAQVKLAYISQPTEWGTIYSLSELTALYSYCKAHGLYLFIDGARLGCALTCDEADFTLRDIAAYCDVFTIGGTKNGALFGEAIVISAPAIADDFRYIMKQRGALLAKGRLLGIQYEQLFTNDLYLRAARNACAAARRITDALNAKGIALRYQSPTNQIFPILDAAQLARLGETLKFSIIERLPDGRTVIRIATSWATSAAAVDAAVKAIAEL